MPEDTKMTKAMVGRHEGQEEKNNHKLLIAAAAAEARNISFRVSSSLPVGQNDRTWAESSSTQCF